MKGKDSQDQKAGFAYIWEFTVSADRQAEFEDAYGPNGAWVQLFRKHSGFRGTQLLRTSTDPPRYWTIDQWDSEESQRAFRRDFSAEFEDLDRRCEALTISERHLGDFDLKGKASA